MAATVGFRRLLGRPSDHMNRLGAIVTAPSISFSYCSLTAVRSLTISFLEKPFSKFMI